MTDEFDEAQEKRQKEWGEEQEHLASESAAAEAEADAQVEHAFNPMTLEELKEKLDDIMLEASIKGFNRGATFGDISSRDKILQTFIQFCKENLPELKGLTGEAPIEEKAAFALGVETYKEKMLEVLGSVKEVMR